MLQFVHDDSQIYLQSSYSGGSVDDDDIIMNHFMSPLILHPKKQLKFAFVCEYLFKKKTHLKFVTIHKMNTRKHGKIEVTYSYFHKKREHYNYLNHHHNYYFVLLCEYYVKLITKNMNVNAFCEEQSVNAFSENSPFKITLTPHDVIFAVYIPSMQSICYCYIQTQSKICIYLMASDVYPYQCVIPLMFQIYTECYENVEGVLMDRVVDLDQRIKVLFEAFDLRKTVPQSSKENGEFTIQALQHYDPITFDEMHVVNIADILS